MECKMSLVCALDMAALSARCSALSMVYNGVQAPASASRTKCRSHILSANHTTLGASHCKCENSSRCTPQQVHVRSAHSSDVSYLLRASTP